jgi:hypothetical protein
MFTFTRLPVCFTTGYRVTTIFTYFITAWFYQNAHYYDDFERNGTLYFEARGDFYDSLNELY